MPDRMSPLDATFLYFEDEDPQASLAISSVAVLEGPAPTDDEFLTAIRAKLHLVPRYRQKVRQLPFDLGSPLWIDDPAFDLNRHFRRTRLEGRGDDAALCEQVGVIMSLRLERDRPLWQYWLIDGLAGGRWAVVSKVHHCMVDGVSGTHLYDVIFDTTPEGSDAEVPQDTWHAAAEPSTLRLAAEAVWDLALNPVEQVRMLGTALRSPRATAGRIVDTARGLARLAETLVPVTGNSLLGPLGKQRRYAFARASLPGLVDVGHQAGVTFNDVVLSVISGGFRTVLQQRHESLDSHAVRSLVPVSVRAPGTEGVYENRVSMMLADLPVHLSDPVARLKAVHEHLDGLKASMEAQAGEAMTTLARHEPYPLISWPLRLAMRMPQRNIVTVTTNVPGPRRPLYLLGRRLVEILPYVPIAYRLRTGISIFTYGGQVTFGVTGDAAGAPEVERLAAAIEAEVRALLAAYRPAASSAAPTADAAPTAVSAAPKKAPRKRTPAGKSSAPKVSTPTRPTAPAKTAIKSRRSAKP